MNDEKTRVFILSSQTLMRQGIEYSLSHHRDMHVSSAADINNEVISTMDNLPPDVAIVDVDGSSDSGFTSVRLIKQRLPNIGVIALTSSQSDTQLFQALHAQVAAYLNKEVTAEQLVDTIKRVARGEHPINESLINRPDVVTQVIRQFQRMSPLREVDGLFSPLTQRETEILNCMAQGHKNRQIAIELGIGEQTIKNHVTSILRKLNVNARTEAVVVALRQGLITIG